MMKLDELREQYYMSGETKNKLEGMLKNFMRKQMGQINKYLLHPRKSIREMAKEVKVEDLKKNNKKD